MVPGGTGWYILFRLRHQGIAMNITYHFLHIPYCRMAGALALLTGIVITGAAEEAVARSGNTGGTAVGFSAEPKLVSEGTVDLPVLRLLKKGVSGTVVVEVDLDQTGAVEGCRVRSGIDPELDSVVAASMRMSRFTPAYEQGSAVPSTVSLQFTFNPHEVLRKSDALPPSVYGTVFEGTTTVPVAGATVNLQLTDSLADAELKIASGAYLELIGEVSGQSERSGILSTVTDSLGRFAFRLLPSCPFRMAVTARGYEVAHAAVAIAAESSKKITCRLEPIERDSTIEVVVYGSPLDKTRMDIEEEQLASGLTHYLSDVLKTKVTIRSVPESRSRMMVRAGNPFDNRYYVCGVPMLAPFHFGGHSYADIDGLMISALSEIDLTIDGIAGRQIDASGFRLDAQPGIYRPANRELLKRPELSVDYSTIGQDFLLSLPKKKSDNVLQLGFTRSEKGTMKFLSGWYDFQENQYGIPAGYGNVTVTGTGRIKTLRFDSFSWFAWDTYLSQKPIPWGMAAVTVRSDKKKAPVISVGGSRQYFASGKRAGGDQYKVFSSYTNGSAGVSFDSLGGRVIGGTVDITTEMVRWDGSVQKFWREVSDSFQIRGSTEYLSKDTTALIMNTSGNGELSFQLHGALMKTFGPFTVNIDLLGAGLIYDETPDAIGDAGVSLVWHGDHIEAGLNGGRVTTRPDTRGLPDSLFRRLHCSSYLISAPVLFRFGPQVRFGIQPYLRKKVNEPKLDPVLQVWDPGATSRLYAAGADIDGDFKLLDWLSVNGAVNIARSYRETGGRHETYEWDIPWTGRWGIHTQFGNEAQMHFYLNGVAAKGMPFYDFVEYGYIRAPDYFRLDFSMQYRSRFIDHRFLTRYDAYFNVFNLTDTYNATDYYWDSALRIHPVPLGEMMIQMGVRLGFRV